MLVRASGLAELLGQLLDPASIRLEVVAEARSTSGDLSVPQGRPVTKGLHLGLQRVGALDRRPELLPGDDQEAMQLVPVRRVGGKALLLSGHLGESGVRFAAPHGLASPGRMPFGLMVAPLPIELLPQGPDLLAQFVVAPGRLFGLVSGHVLMPPLGQAERPLGLVVAGGQVVTLVSQGLDLRPGRIGLAADLLQLFLEGDEVQLVLPQGGLAVAPLAVELALQLPDSPGQLVGTSPCVLRLGDVPGDLGLESRMFLAGGLGLPDRGIALEGPGLGLAQEPVDFFLEGPEVPVEPGLDGVDSLPPIPRRGLRPRLLLDESAFGVLESCPKLLVARLRGPPLRLPSGDGLVATPGELDAGRFAQGRLLGQPSSDLAQLGPELLVPARALQAIGLEAVAVGAEHFDLGEEPGPVGVRVCASVPPLGFGPELTTGLVELLLEPLGLAL